MPDPQPFTDDDRADLIAYLDGELQGAAQRRVENRLVTDPMVRAEADSLKRAWDLLDYLPRPEPSNSFTERTLTLVAAHVVPSARTQIVARPWRWRPMATCAVWAVALLLALGIGYSVTPGRRPVSAAEINPDTDVLVKREPTVIENLPLYLAAENLDYLLALDQSELFADDGTGG